MAGALEAVELRELRIFLALADELHFGRTAERLGVSQPAVSEAIRLLERRLGLLLFERTSRRVALTPAGLDLRGRVAPALGTLGRALSDARDDADGVAGIVRVGTTFTTLLPPVFALGRAFQARHPRCTVDFAMAAAEDPYASLRRGQVDVLVNWLAVDESDLAVGPAIAYYDRVLFVGPGHRLAGRECVSVEELAGEALNNPRPPSPERSPTRSCRRGPPTGRESGVPRSATAPIVRGRSERSSPQ
jgi:DNA-binding transcriptional LysR family regulator